MAPKSETRAFRIHPQLLYDVIQRQAGTLTKALGEGIMNSIDAKATQVRLTLTDTQATIVDDGNGFPSRKYVENFFETFGQPHKEGDATYGTFRMGRGQMFSFGVNHWRSGRFEMHVDIKNRGLDYDLTEVAEDRGGCLIAIDLYQPLTLLQRREIADEIRRMVRYVNVPVFLDGEQINKRPASESWDHEDADAYYKFAGGRLTIYNLGVYVNDHRAYALGIGGVVVAKKQLRLNFARNDVLNDCPVWTRITKVLRKRADRNIQAKRSALSAEERAMLAQRLRSKDLTPKEAREAAVFQDATGRWLTIEKLKTAAGNCNGAISAGIKSARAEKVQKARMAVVLNEALFDEFFRVDNLEELVAKVIKPNDPHWPAFKLEPLDKFAPNSGERFDVIAPSKYTPQEAVVLEVCNQLEPPDFAAKRRIILGDSDHADGWTDGGSYIAINRKFLKGKTIGSPETWTSIALLLCHEYSHGDISSSSTHVHSPEFYEQYHDGSVGAVPGWGADGLKFTRKAVENMKGKVSRRALQWLDAIDAADKGDETLDQTLLAAREKHGRPKVESKPRSSEQKLSHTEYMRSYRAARRAKKAAEGAT